jgi:hypothetical protein
MLGRGHMYWTNVTHATEDAEHHLENRHDWFVTKSNSPNLVETHY